MIKKAQNSPSIVGVDLVKEVTCQKPYEFTEALPKDFEWGEVSAKGKRHKIVALDCGIKKNILRKLNQHGFEVTGHPPVHDNRRFC